MGREKFSQRTRDAGIQQDFHAACSAVLWAYSKTATACSRVTSGKQSKYSSRLRPLSRLLNRLSTGTRVPAKEGAPLNRSGSTQIGTSGGNVSADFMQTNLSASLELSRNVILHPHAGA